MGRTEIRRVDSPESDSVGFDGLAVVYREAAAERDPGDPLPSRREIVAEMFGSSPDRTVRNYLAIVDGEPAGLGWALTISEADDELQLAEVDLMVRPRHRRQGVATALIAELIPDLIGLGQTSIVAYTCPEVTPEATSALCRKLGMTKRGEERCSRAGVVDIDENLLAGWIEDAEEDAAGYRLEQWEGLCPDHLAEQWSQAMAAMEDEPLDDFDYNPHTRSADVQRQADEIKIGHGYRIYRTLALSPGGEAAGISALYVHEDRPQLGHQADTGVLARHRGHGLGRWMKAANYEQVVRAHPDLGVIQTYNAESNPWMLDINVAMGFVPYHAYVGYQGPIETVAAAVGGRD